VLVDFGHVIRAQALRTIERMGHRRHAGGIDRLELVDHGHDTRQLRRYVGYFGGRYFEARQPAQSLDVFGAKHGVFDAVLWPAE